MWQGEAGADALAVQMMVDYIAGHLGGSQVQCRARCRARRVVVHGTQSKGVRLCIFALFKPFNPRILHMLHQWCESSWLATPSPRSPQEAARRS